MLIFLLKIALIKSKFLKFLFSLSYIYIFNREKIMNIFTMKNKLAIQFNSKLKEISTTFELLLLT